MGRTRMDEEREGKRFGRKAPPVSVGRDSKSCVGIIGGKPQCGKIEEMATFRDLGATALPSLVSSSFHAQELPVWGGQAGGIVERRVLGADVLRKVDSCWCVTDSWPHKILGQGIQPDVNRTYYGLAPVLTVDGRSTTISCHNHRISPWRTCCSLASFFSIF